MEYIATRAAYGDSLVQLGEKNDKVVVLDADLSGATYTNKFRKAFPDRFFDCGIAEGNMVDIAAGISTAGYVPFVSTFAIFGTGRAYEQIRNSVAYPHFNVKFAFTHAGITVGEDGGSHQSIEDIALMRVIPGMTIVAPADANETAEAVFQASKMNGPVYIRLSRMATEVLPAHDFKIGKACALREGNDAVIFATGIMNAPALSAAKQLAESGMQVSVVDVPTIKPIDRDTILAYASRCRKVVTAEEHSVIGGFGDAVADVLIGNGDFKFRKVGIQDMFGQSGKPEELLKEYHLTDSDIAEAVKSL